MQAFRPATTAIRFTQLAAMALCMGLLLLTTVGIASADEPPKLDEAAKAKLEKLTLQVKRLVRGLNDPNVTNRDESEQKLVELGVEVLDLLPQISKRMPAETQHRLGRIRQQLERAAAEAAVQASKLTLAGEAVTLAELFAAVEKQTGNKLVDLRQQFGEADTQIKLSLDLKQRDFWPAIDAILDQAQLSVYSFAGESSLALSAREEGRLDRVGRASYAGAFRFEALRAVAQRDLRIPANQSLSVAVEVAWEPRLRPINISQPLKDIFAQDADGNPVAVAGEDTVLEVPVQSGTTAIELEIPFMLPARSVSEIATLKGKLMALVPGRVETFKFDEVAKADKIEQRRAGVTVVVDTVRENNELWEVRMRVNFDKTSGALESHRGWIYRNECYLTDAAGKRIDHAGFETTRQTEDEVGIAYLFELADGLKDCSFVYHTPAAILNLPVEYELKKIQLP